MAAALLVATASCNKEDDGDKPQPVDLPPLTRAQEECMTNITSMSYPLFAEINKQSRVDENFMISPLSASEVLGMLANGAQGETLDEIRQVLNTRAYSLDDMGEVFQTINDYFPSLDPRKVTLAFANSQWMDEGFEVKKEYRLTNSAYFKAQTFVQNLQTEGTMNDINNWCKEKTNGCIDRLLERPLSEDTKMVLINALYFNGKWATPFKKANTKQDIFTDVQGGKDQVQMMALTHDLQAMKGEKYDIAELPYGNNKFVMDVILPHEGETLADCLEGMTEERMKSDLAAMREYEVSVKMPRMELKYKTSLVPSLRAIGVTKMFTPSVADFSGMGDEDLYVSEVKQVTYIKVDEEGTEAAAVTGGMVDSYLAPAPNELLTFHMNRPFAYMIREKKTGVILFMGRVVKL